MLVNKSNDTLFPQRQVGHLKSWWMLSLYAHKCLLCTRLSRAWRVALAQLCGKPMSPLKPLVPRLTLAWERHHPQMGKKVRGKEEGKQVWNCWHCDHNVRNGDDWCDEGTDRRKWGALACISLHALKQHELSHTGPLSREFCGTWGGFHFTSSGCHVTDSQWGGTVSSLDRKWLAGPREANYSHFPSTGKGGFDWLYQALPLPFPSCHPLPRHTEKKKKQCRIYMI